MTQSKINIDKIDSNNKLKQNYIKRGEIYFIFNIKNTFSTVQSNKASLKIKH